MIWEFRTGSGAIPQGVSGDIGAFAITLGEQWPRPESGAAPQDTPSNVAAFFEQGTSSLGAGNFDATGMMFRKTLEAATKTLDPSSSSKTLVKRIDALVSSGKLTGDLGEWAHEVRLGGNDAAHDDDPFTVEEAEDLRNFIENFLRYSFALPSAVRRRAGSVEQTLN